MKTKITSLLKFTIIPFRNVVLLVKKLKRTESRTSGIQNHILNSVVENYVNTLRTGDADLRFYITTVQDG